MVPKIFKRSGLPFQYFDSITGILNKGYPEIAITVHLRNKYEPGLYIPHHGVTNPAKPEKLLSVFGRDSKFHAIL